MPEQGALVIYGRGAELGNFKFFADDLVTTELSSYGKEHIHIENIERRNAFFNLLLNPQRIIKELHIYAHSIGGDLYIGYGDDDLSRERVRIIKNAAATGTRPSYQTVLDAEQGAILTDDLVRSPYAGYRDRIRHNFAAGAKIKIWGCNSGIADWNYSDPIGNGYNRRPQRRS